MVSVSLSKKNLKMKKEKLNLKSIKNVLSRGEMKNIMAGSNPTCPDGMIPCTCTASYGSVFGCVFTVAQCWNLC